MSAADVVYGMLTVLFAAVALHALRHGDLLRTFGWRGRIDQLLHAVMALAMTVMPWGGGRVLPEVQTAWFAAAAVWFPLTAVRRGQEPRPVAAASRLPHAVAMAAMAWMTHSMADASHEVRSRGVPEAHQAAHLAHSAGESTVGDLVTGVLASYLITSAPRSLTRDMPPLRGARDTVGSTTDTRVPHGHFWDGTMSLGTVVMLLMHP
ncbi:DUF5134 domain-containing protein [Streptomyces sp. NPDC050743]|uniref:DUF5134 domain-containing protein n=1 Tax=Streptomyces sp. NPDC050743 TaxID=3365634 RepID=UPI0037BAE9A2